MAEKKKSGGNAALGAGVAAAVAAAALGAYFLYGKDGQKNRRKVKGWMLKAKGEILERVEGLESVSQDAYEDIVKKVLAGYKGAKNVTSAEVLEMTNDARRHWQALRPLFKKQGKGGSSKGKAKRAPARRNSRKPAGKSGS